MDILLKYYRKVFTFARKKELAVLLFSFQAKYLSENLVDFQIHQCLNLLMNELLSFAEIINSFLG